MKRSFFVTGTDTGVGKTMSVYALALVLRDKGLDVGVMKPFQSGPSSGGDAQFLKKNLGLADAIREINPYAASEPLSPHVAFKRARIRVDRRHVVKTFRALQSRHDVVLVEGAGGLLVPVAEDYVMADLAKELGLSLIVVARLELGTINHTLLTVREAERRGIDVAGVLFSDAKGKDKGIPEKTNPEAVRKLSGVPILGVVPCLQRKDPASVLKLCRGRIRARLLMQAASTGVNDRLVQKDKDYVWHPFTQMQDWMADAPGVPLVIDRAEGSYLVDVNGKRYLDGVSSLWVTVHGHGRREIVEALARQAARLDHSTMLGLSNAPAVELAEALVKIAPPGLKKVFYSDNGSTSVEIAVKMAYQYWQNMGRTKKTLICHLENSYHGDTLGSVSIGGIGLFHQVYRKLIFKTMKVAFPDCFRVPVGKKYPDYVFEAVDAFEGFLKKNHHKTAALVLEPMVQGAAGMIMWPRGVLKRFEDVCRRYDVFLICDEVATGFGRTGTMFACEHEGVRPDFLCVAKGLTGGVLPLAATLTTRQVFDGFVFPYKEMKTFFHGHTYTGNPIACAAALANLAIFEKDKTLQTLRPKIGYLAERLERLKTIPIVGDVRQRGFMVGVELVKNRDTKEPFPWQDRVGVLVCERARQYGVILRPLGNVIVLMPPLSMSLPELDLVTQATERSILDVMAQIKPLRCGC